jgi:hypothetical protein
MIEAEVAAFALPARLTEVKMNPGQLNICVVVLAVSSCLLGTLHPLASSAETAIAANTSDGAIIPNVGQWKDDVLCRATGSDGTLWVTRSGMMFVAPEHQPVPPHLCQDSKDSHREVFRSAASRIESRVHPQMAFGESATPLSLSVQSAVSSRAHFFLGNNPDHWQADVPVYRTVNVTGFDADVKLVLDVAGGVLTAQWESPDENLLSAVLDRLGFTDWDQTPVGLRSVKSPEEYHGAATQGASRPATAAASVTFATYLGGTDFDAVYGMTLDPNGDIILIGNSESADFPMVNPYDGTFGGGSFGDVVVIKLDGDDGSVVFSTYIGGTGPDIAAGVVTDESGNIYGTGITGSANSFPRVNPYDMTYNGSGDAFIFKLSPAGTVLLQSTLLGGSGEDYGHAIDVGADGSVYVTGHTESADFPVTPELEDTFQGGVWDAFLCVLGPTGTTLAFGTFLGGSSDEDGLAVSVDPAGNCYVSGWTGSSDFPMANAYDDSYGGGERDVFLSKISATRTLTYSTYLGGSGSDYATGMALGSSGEVTLSGVTRSTEFPSVNAYDATLGGSQDLFVTQVAPDGQSLTFSTYLGGDAEEFNGVVAMGACGFPSVSAYTYSDDYPTINALDDVLDNTPDVVVSILSADGSALSFSSYLGGDSTEFNNAIAIRNDDLFVCGVSNSTNLPVVGASASPLNAGYDGFLVRLTDLGLLDCPCDCPTHADPNDDDVVNVFDVVIAVSIAFRSEPPTQDILCPFESTDVDCNGVTNVFDVVKFVDVAFRSGNPATNFCDPCL